MQSFQDFFASLSSNVNVKGKAFEGAIKWWLESDPVWSSQLKQIWLWNEFPHKTGRDTGIDLVAESSFGDYWAIQCKAYSPDSHLKKADIDSFLSASNRKLFTHRLLVTTTKGIGANARETLAAQEKPVQVVDWIRLSDSAVDWSMASKEQIKPLPKPRELRLHQQKALDAVVIGMKHSDRGQLIMACGSGKTLTALRISEALTSDLTVVLVPSLTLLSQTLNDWLVDRIKPFSWLAVCSDDSVANDPQDNSRLIDFDFPATTNLIEISKFLSGVNSKVVFSTYHSSPILLDAIKKSKKKVNLLICDEAHRLAGKTGRDFGAFLDSKAPVTKRLFMTATPRIFSPQIRKMLESSDLNILSMDDKEIFGSIFFNYSFAQAIKDNILTDYRVVIVGISSKEVSELVDKRVLVKAGAIETDSESLALHVALAKAMKKWNLRRVISFHSRVSKARKFGSDQALVNQWMPKEEILAGEFTARTISSSMPTDKRRTILDVLKNVDESKSCLVTNARCLTEGIDVPTLDAVVFVDPKSSQVDIIQAVGRAIRIGGPTKTHGTIVVPIFIPQSKKELANFDSTNYKKIGDVLNALRAHDQEFGEVIDKLRGEIGRRGSIERMPEKLIWDLPANISPDFARHVQAQSIELASSSWDEMCGRLVKFVETFGHAKPTAVEIFEGTKIGGWVVKQRTQYRQGLLPLERVRKLESVSNDWTWDPLENNWQTRFDEIVEFVRQSGTSRISSKDERTAQMGKWLSDQRGKYRSGELSTEKINLLESVSNDWTWDPLEEDWQAMFDLLKEYEAREGHTAVTATYRENGEHLGNWVFHQRSNYLNPDTLSRLSLKRIEKLEGLSSWSWDPTGDDFKIKFELLKLFISERGTSRVPVDFEINGVMLGKWINHKRTAFKKGRMDTSEINQFESCAHDWSWAPFLDTWEEAYARLCDYVAEFGNSRIPNETTYDGFNLGIWVSNQKSKYKQGKLTSEQINRLENVNPDWTWDLMETVWQEYFEELKEFVQVNGHANAPYKVNGVKSNLGEWVTGQRKFFSRGKMIPSRKLLLDSIGFRWEPIDTWGERYLDLLQFFEREGHARVNWKHVENERNLGGWINDQRAKYKTGDLSSEQISKLEVLNGWDWAPGTGSKPERAS